MADPFRQVAEDFGLPLLPDGVSARLYSGEGLGGLRRLGLLVQQGLRRRMDGAACWVGIGSSVRAGADLSVSRREAEEAVSFGRLVWSEPRVLLYEDALLAAAIGSNPRTRDRLAAILDPLAMPTSRGGGALLATLEAFFEQESARATAKRLGVHRHTVEQRLRQVERILGRQIRGGPDRLLVEIALLARGMRSR